MRTIINGSGWYGGTYHRRTLAEIQYGAGTNLRNKIKGLQEDPKERNEKRKWLDERRKHRAEMTKKC